MLEWEDKRSLRRSAIRSVGRLLAGLALVLTFGGAVGSAQDCLLPQTFPLIPADAVWEFEQHRNLDDEPGWTTDLTDPAIEWQTGQGLFGFEDNSAIVPLIRTTLESPCGLSVPAPRTYCFRTHFQWPGPGPPVPTNAQVELRFAARIDDGAVFYLNGVEIHRLRMPAAPDTYALLASEEPAGGDAVQEEQFTISGVPLREGDNVLAVSVHQFNCDGNDVVFGLTLEGRAQCGQRPVIVQPPVGWIVPVGCPVTLAVLAEGCQPLSSQWLLEEAPIAGATGSTYTLPSPQTNHAGSYSVVVSNGWGSVTSAPVRLDVLAPPPAAPPLILVQPQHQTNDPSTSVGITLRVCATGTEPLLYQWRLNGADLPGESNSALFIAGLSVPNYGAYSVVVANDFGVAASEEALLLPQDLGPPGPDPGSDGFADRASLGNASSNSVASANFAATGEPGEPPHANAFGTNSVWYRWTAPADGIVTFDTRGSAFDTLLDIFVGTELTNLALMASDDDSGGFYTSLASFNVVSNQTYAIRLDGFLGERGHFVLSWQLEETSDTLPVITDHPGNQTVYPGSTATFSVTASNVALPVPAATNLTYQWFFNGRPLPGATEASFTRTRVQPDHVGGYFVVVSNGLGRFVQSQTALLEIGPVPEVHSVDKLGLLGGGDATGGMPLYLVSAGSIGSHTLNLTNSMTQSGETNLCQRVPRATRALAFDFMQHGAFRCALLATGLDFDPVLAVYRWPETQIPSDCQVSPPGKHQAGLEFGVTNRATLIVRMGAVIGAPGMLVLSWQFGPGQAPYSLALSNGAPVELLASYGTNEVPLPAFQWYRNGAILRGSTQPSLSLQHFNLTHAGLYSVVASNQFIIVSNVAACLTLAGCPTLSITRGLGGLAPSVRLLAATTNAFVLQATTQLEANPVWWPISTSRPPQCLFEYVETNLSWQRFFRACVLSNAPACGCAGGMGPQ
jgi:hypothetical protein